MTATLSGTFYQMRGAINQPKGVQQPHIPLLIGGDGEQVTLKLVARYANACNVQGDCATLAHKFAVLKGHCEAVGRDYQRIHRTTNTLCLMAETDEQALAQIPDDWKADLGEAIYTDLIGSPATIRQRLAAYEEVGVQELLLDFFTRDPLPAIRRFAAEFM